MDTVGGDGFEPVTRNAIRIVVNVFKSFQKF